MREIKFRGKRVYNGEWVYGNFVMYDEQASMFVLFDGDEYPTVEPVDPATVGQSTGLKDKNGQEIYEGDLIEFKSGISTCFGNKPTVKESVHVDAVEWMGIECAGRGRGCWGTRIVKADKFNDHKLGNPVSNAIHTPIHLYGEIIGNIHDSHELLEEK